MGELELLHHGEEQPTFVTPGQTYRIAAGSTVVLPCRITNPGSYVLVWKRGTTVLTAGYLKVTPDPRVRLLSSSAGSTLPGIPGLAGGSYSLELKHVKPHDAGDYVCQIGTMEPKEITHTLEILVPPRIHYVSHTGPLDVRQGDTVKLECRASGNPVPTVIWTRRNNNLPSGERSVNGLSLVIQHADRHSEGEYQCSADNGVGEPDNRSITLIVRYAPEVETERATVHTGVGLEAHLVCIIHAGPPPDVLWFKDTTQLGVTEQHTAQTRGNRYTLVIRNVTDADFGNYSCLATNPYGKARGHLTLTGTAGLAMFDSPPVGSERENYNVSWSVNSHAAVIECELFFRQRYLHRSHLVYDNRTSITMNDKWNSVIIPTQGDTNSVALPPFPGVTRQKMSYVIRGLHPSTSYEARVQARNVYGWNKLSPVFHFATRSNEIENMVEPSAQPATYGASQHAVNFFSGSRGLLQPRKYQLALVLLLFRAFN